MPNSTSLAQPDAIVARTTPVASRSSCTGHDFMSATRMSASRKSRKDSRRACWNMRTSSETNMRDHTERRGQRHAMLWQAAPGARSASRTEAQRRLSAREVVVNERRVVQEARPCHAPHAACPPAARTHAGDRRRPPCAHSSMSINGPPCPNPWKRMTRLIWHAGRTPVITTRPRTRADHAQSSTWHGAPPAGPCSPTESPQPAARTTDRACAARGVGPRAGYAAHSHAGLPRHAKAIKRHVSEKTKDAPVRVTVDDGGLAAIRCATR